MNYKLLILALLLGTSAFSQSRWTEEKANKWYAAQSWMSGSNFQPSTAINQLEMFLNITGW